MLMMKRRQGEAILNGEDIEIQLAHIGRSKVKLAIRAPRHLRVIAKEIQQVGNENQAAADLAPTTDLADVLSQIQPAPSGAEPLVCGRPPGPPVTIGQSILFQVDSGSGGTRAD